MGCFFSTPEQEREKYEARGMKIRAPKYNKNGKRVPGAYVRKPYRPRSRGPTRTDGSEGPDEDPDDD